MHFCGFAFVHQFAEREILVFRHRLRKLGLLLACIVSFIPLGYGLGVAAPSALPEPEPFMDNPAARWAGKPVRRIVFEGVAADRMATVVKQLPVREGVPLLLDDVAASLRALFATGLYQSIEADTAPNADGVELIFRGVPRAFIGTVTVDGARGATVNTQLERAARLNAGTRLTEAKLNSALELMKQVLAENGYYEPKITYDLAHHASDQLTDVALHVESGPRARLGHVEVTGDSGLTPEEFMRHAKLKIGRPVDREIVSRALAGVLKYYRREHRLEAEIKLVSRSYAAQKVTYRFTATRGPVVRVSVNGASIDQGRIKRLVPIFEEGTVDEDLLNEGNRRLRDYFQSLGYFDARVDHTADHSNPGQVLIAFNVTLGGKSRVEHVHVAGNKYFDAATLNDLLSVHTANTFERHGLYNQALVSSDVASLSAVYQNNGFSRVKVTPEVHSGSQADDPPAGSARPAPRKIAPMAVTYHIEEGPQQRVGSVHIEGNAHVPTETLQAQMNTEAGQLLSPHNLAGDRDALTIDYLSRGFQRVQVSATEKNDPADPTRVDIAFEIDEGPQTFVRNVLLTGLHFTRPQTVHPSVSLNPGDPLSQTALEQMQHDLYGYGLFNEVNTAVQNPGGDNREKTVLVQAIEARRYTFTYGGGFEVQTGTPVNGCAGLTAAGVTNCSPNGKTGISPRILLALTRNNLFGREQSASLQGNYGLLEQRLDLIYQNPHFAGKRNLSLTITSGYDSSQAVTTYEASRLEAGFRVTQSFASPSSLLSRANSFVYAYDLRRVKVQESSLQTFPDTPFISLLSSAVRVGGPSFTWLRDTRDSAIDSHRGMYSSFQEFFSGGVFGAEAKFNRIDISNSSYHGWDKNRWVLARNTRYGQERAFGNGNERLLPLPERLYAGGATSFRAYGSNAAGPRDPQTGFPIGGAGTFVNNVELRMPPPTLPYFGNSISFVLFHDMGNVFNNAGDIWASVIRIKQPNRDTCKVLTPPQFDAQGKPFLPNPGGEQTSTGPHGNCSFNYFNHAPGLGVRYHTPVGPIRLDFSYTLNPPIFPISANYSQKDPANPDNVAPFYNQHVGEGPRFNFYFSLGQTF
jgi:outer membrane protein assembly factor BamA